MDGRITNTTRATLLDQEETTQQLSSSSSSLETAQVSSSSPVIVVDDHFVSKEEARMYFDSVMVKHGLQNDCQTNVLSNFFNSSTNLAYKTTSVDTAHHHLDLAPARMGLFQKIETEQKNYKSTVKHIEDMMKSSSQLIFKNKLPAEKLSYRLTRYEYTLKTSGSFGEDTDDTAYETDQIRKEAENLIHNFTKLRHETSELQERINDERYSVTEKLSVVNSRLSLMNSTLIVPITGFLGDSTDIRKSTARVRSWSDTCGVMSSNEVSMLKCISDQLDKLEEASTAFNKLVDHSEKVVRNFCKQAEKMSLALRNLDASTEICDETIQTSKDAIQAMNEFVGFDVSWAQTATRSTPTTPTSTSTSTSTSPIISATSYRASC